MTGTSVEKNGNNGGTNRQKGNYNRRGGKLHIIRSAGTVEFVAAVREDIATGQANLQSRRNVMRRFILFMGIALLLCLGRSAAAETKVTVSETHLCCRQCMTAVDGVLKGVAGVTYKADQGAKTIEIIAENDAAAQKAIDTLADAGFYGKLDNESIKFKPVTTADAAVEKLEISGVHNCCGACTNAIKKAVTSVGGVSGTDVKAKESSFVVEGKFK